METWLEVAAKAVVYAATLLIVGAAGLRWLLLPQVKNSLSASHCDAITADAQRILLRAAVVLVVGLVLRVLAHTVAAFGFADAWTWDNIRVIALESRWGGGWQRQFAVAVLLLAAAIASGSLPRLGLVSGIAGAGFCFALPLLGHASGEASGVAIHGFHALAAGGWVGTLSCTMIARSDLTIEARPILLRAFAPVAMVSVGFLLATGALAALSYLGALSNLWTTPYGRLLGLKLAGVAAALSLGGANWWRMHRRGRLPQTSLARAEVLGAVLIVAITAWLSETAHP